MPRYKKQTLTLPERKLERIQKNPSSYLGSIEKKTQTCWVFDNDELVYKDVSYVPALYMIFDEILVMAAGYPTLSDFNIYIGSREITIFSSGYGHPVKIHPEKGVYIPEVVFSDLSGRPTEYGHRLTNIFSKRFEIETADGSKKYKQVFMNNMGNKSKPEISDCYAGDKWTKVTFKPDLAKFNMKYLDKDVVAIMKKRALDLAGCLGTMVILNDQWTPVISFLDYVDLYLKSKSSSALLPRFTEKVNDKWEICVSISRGQFQQVSFVNSINTIKGGTHVDYVTNQITNHVVTLVNKKNKQADVKAEDVKSHLWVFVNALIDNPTFDSQSKETLTTRQSSFGSKCELSHKFLEKVANSGIVERLYSCAEFKLSKERITKLREAKKAGGNNVANSEVVDSCAEFKLSKKRITKLREAKKAGGNNVANSEIVDSCPEFKLSKERITKLREAKEAGGNNGDKCTLILTDSPKALAMLGSMDLKYYGVFPLSGKPLNVREASPKQIMENAEIQHIKKILGLQDGKVYNSDNVKSLRYGHLMIMTDQVQDGSHIKGLLINFIHSFFPSMLKIPSFLVEFIVPLVKATHDKGNILSFYTMHEYNSWKETIKKTSGDENDWVLVWFSEELRTGITSTEANVYFQNLEMHKRELTCMYYWEDVDAIDVGLGTSNYSKEANAYFQILELHKKDFACLDWGVVDAIDVAFRKKFEERKTWVRELVSWEHLPWKEKLNKHNEFVNKQLILFPLADLQRFIPSMVDGLNDVQRKILFCAFKCDLVAEKTVAEFSGYVLRNSAYHHDEESLTRSIIWMAQDFVGSNNINLFNPGGQFGSREMGGKDHGSAWHICTNLNPIARFLFPKEDDNLVHSLNENGKSMMEAKWYVPVIPFVLVNGSERIGNGWSTFVPNYDPKKLCANIRCLLQEKEKLSKPVVPIVPIDPWYKGFKGTIKKTIKESGASYTVSGKIEKSNDMKTLRIQELPVCKWTTKGYMEFLETARTGTGKFKEPFIQNYLRRNDDTTRYFEIIMSKEYLQMTTEEELMKKFKLTTTISTSNMLMFDQERVIKKYDNPEQILEDFFHFRLSLYEKRKEMLLESHKLEGLELKNKLRFIRGVMNDEIKILGKKGVDIFLDLKQKGFEIIDGGYKYLLSMRPTTMNEDHIQVLLNQQQDLTSKVDELRNTTPEAMWMKDLEAFEQKLDELELKDAKAAVDRKNLRAEFMEKQHQLKKPTNTPVEEAAPVSSSSMEMDNVSEAVKRPPKGRGGARKAPAKKQQKPTVVDNNEDDEILGLKDHLAAYNLDSSLDQPAAMKEAGKVPSRKTALSKTPAAQTQPTTTLTEISDDTMDDDHSDEDYLREEWFYLM